MKIFICLFILLVAIAGCGVKQQDQGLTKAQKFRDFEYLYETLKSTYPYFDVNKRLHKVDWLANKELYYKQVENARTDTLYAKVISNILGDLNSGHTDLMPTKYYEYFRDTYSRIASQDSRYQPYVDLLADTLLAERTKFFQNFLNQAANRASNQVEATESDREKVTDEDANVKFNYDSINSIAIWSVRSFDGALIQKDSAQIAQNLPMLNNYKHLIIDIQGNSGGADDYWISNIVGNLIDDPLTYPVVFGYKDSPLIRKLKPNYKANAVLKDLNFSNLPAELKSGDFVFKSDSNIVYPNDVKRAYSGEVYLLVDHYVFSSSETFAYFCKTTKFATIAGEQTGGDGIGTDPLLIRLPESGLLIRFPGEMALNPDGSANEEMKTQPDIPIPRSNDSLQLQDLLRLVISNSD